MKIGILIFLFFIDSKVCIPQSGWTNLNSGTDSSLNSVQFINSLTGWCIGNGGIILNTTNGGFTWEKQNSGFNFNLNSMCFTSLTTGYIAGDSGLIIKTTNGGKSWNRTSLISYHNLTSLNFINDSTGFAGGSNLDNDNPTNKIYKSIDFGYSWDSIEVQTEFTITRVHFVSSQIGWAVRLPPALGGAALIKTIDSGSNWSFSFFTNDNIYSLFFLDSLNGFISSSIPFGIKGILRTTNGGDNWIPEIFPVSGYRMNSIFFINNNYGWAAGEYKIIEATTNGGISWNTQTNPKLGTTFNSIYFTDSLTGWVVGDSGIILKTTTGGILTNFSIISTEIPDKFSLSQNYPNPFNPSTVINFSIPKSGLVKLKVYDITGREVAVLVNEIKAAGNYRYDYNSINMNSGIYFYKLESDGFTDIKKMAFIK